MLVRLQVSQHLDGKVHQCFTKDFEASDQYLFVSMVNAWVASFVRHAKFGERLSIVVCPPEQSLNFVEDLPKCLLNTKYPNVSK